MNALLNQLHNTIEYTKVVQLYITGNLFTCLSDSFFYLPANVINMIRNGQFEDFRPLACL